MNKTKKIIIAVIAAIIVIAIAIGATYAYTDVFKSSKDLFYKYLAKNFETSSEFNYNEMLNSYKEMEEKYYTATGEITLNVESEEDDIQEVFDEINKIKIKTEEKSIPSENKLYADVKLDYNNNSLLEASMVRNNDLYGIKSDMLHEKYISAENNNLKELAEKLGMDEDSIPDKFEEINIYELLYVSKEDRKTILSTYKKVLDESFSKDKYNVEKNVEITVNDEKIKTNAYSINISEKEALNMSIKFLETLKNDDLTLDLVVEKVNKTNVNNVVDEDEKLTKDTLKESIEDSLEDLKDEVEYASDDYITIKVYANKGKTVKTEILSEDQTISLEKYAKDNENYVVVKVVEDDEEVSKITVKYVVKEENGAKVVNGSVELKSESEDDITFNFEITSKGKVGKGVNEVSFIISFEVEEVKVKLTANESIDFDTKVEIEELNDENSIKLNNMSEQEMTSLFNDVSKNVQKELTEIMKDEKYSDLIKLLTGGSSTTYEEDYDLDSIKSDLNF